jgi:hypothetical protein
VRGCGAWLREEARHEARALRTARMLAPWAGLLGWPGV